MRFLGAAPLLTGALLALVTGCGGKVIDHRDLENKLSSYLQLEFGTRVAVSCPAGQSAGKGETFSCRALGPTGKKVNVKVRLENGSGGFSVVSITAAH